MIMKSKRFLRVLSFVSGFVLVISMLASCSGTGKEQKAPAASETEKETGAGENRMTAADEDRTAAADDKAGRADSDAGVEETDSSGAGEASEADDLKPGDRVAGFTYEGSSQAELISSEIMNFSHEKSGAELLYIKNKDPELGFAIFYRTPVTDELDTQHVLEHSIISGSEKYPSTNIFFDLANKTYTTFTNAYTSAVWTGFPLQSMSQEQLMKAADVYLSCMVAPAIAEDPRIFQREAIRRQMYDPDGDIELTGTVFSEDKGYLCDMGTHASNNVLDTLYPGEIASNSIGRAEFNYKDLSYDKVIETYERCYHFDNSIIMLYGDMDYRSFMEFIDREYLDHAEKNGTDLSVYRDPETPGGHVETEIPVPAYTGDSVENASVLSYAIDLDGYDYEDVFRLRDLAGIENTYESSVFSTMLKKHGLYEPASVSVSIESSKPNVIFHLMNTDPSQKDEFLAAVKETIETLSTEGENEKLVRAYAESARLSSLLSRDQSNAAAESIFPDIALLWAVTGRTDIFSLIQTSLKEFETDPQGSVRKAASMLVEPRRSVYVASVPQEGLADEIEEEIREYLVSLKASLSEEEKKQLIADTKAFDEWNENQVSNSDFLIPVEDLPEQKARQYEVIEAGGDHIYYSPADSGEAGSFEMLFDTGYIPREDKYYLELYAILTGMIPTEKHTLEEMEVIRTSEYAGLNMSFKYPGEAAGENSHPCMAVDWSCRTGNLDNAGKYIFEMLSESLFTDTETIMALIGSITERYNPARVDGNSLAANLAYSEYGTRAETTRYGLDLTDQGFYTFLKDLYEQMGSDPETAGQDLQKKMDEIEEKMLRRGNIIILGACSEEDKDSALNAFSRILEALEERSADEKPVYVLPEPDGSEAVAIDSSMQYSYWAADMEKSGFEGRYMPFVIALGDLYTTPLLRFQNGAYSGGSSFSLSRGLVIQYSYSDPNVGKTLDTFDGTADFLMKEKIDEKELDGYILNTFGSVTTPSGVLGDVINDLYRAVEGTDLEERTAFINDIRNAKLSDQAGAAEAMRTGLEKYCTFVTVGNEERLRQEEDRFPRVISYR